MTIVQLRAWLDDTGLSREWLAQELGVSKRTIDGWFRANAIPELASKFLDRVQNDQAVAAAKFSPADWEKIQKAMTLAGYTNYQDFIVDSAIEMARHPDRLTKKK